MCILDKQVAELFLLVADECVQVSRPEKLGRVYSRGQTPLRRVSSPLSLSLSSPIILAFLSLSPVFLFSRVSSSPDMVPTPIFSLSPLLPSSLPRISHSATRNGYAEPSRRRKPRSRPSRSTPPLEAALLSSIPRIQIF